MAKKKSVRKKVVAKKQVAKGDVNKSQEIRDYLAANKGVKNKDVVDALSKKGVVVSPQQVSTIKNRQSTSAKKVRGAGSPKAGSSSSGADQVSLGMLMEAKRFADKVGGVDDAGQLLTALKRLEN